MERLLGAVNEAPVEPDPHFMARLRQRVHDEATVDFELDEGDLIMVDIQTRETDTDHPDDKTGRRWLPYTVLAAAAVIIVVVGAIALFDGTEETTEVDVVDSPADVVTPEPTDEVPSSDVPGDPSAFTESDALEMVEAYYMALDADDADAIAAAFSPETSFDVDAQVTKQVESIAQGSVLSDRACNANDGEAGSFVVVCEGDERDYLHRAVDAPATAAVVTYTVTAQGLQRMNVSFPSDSPRFPAGAAFAFWMKQNHPEDSESASRTLTAESIEEARANGELHRQYADLWAVYLSETGCSYDDMGC